MDWYILNDDKTVTKLPAGEYPKLSAFKSLHVGDNVVNDQRISTVFLQLDHAWLPETKPVLFESMIFNGEHDQYQRRYYTYDEALEGHKKLVQALEEERHPDYYFND